MHRTVKHAHGKGLARVAEYSIHAQLVLNRPAVSRLKSDTLPRSILWVEDKPAMAPAAVILTLLDRLTWAQKRAPPLDLACGGDAVVARAKPLLGVQA